MRKLGIIAVLSLMALALAAVPALADSAKFQSASGRINDSGALLLSWRETGLGNTNGNPGVHYDIHADASAEYACINGGNKHPQAANKETVTTPIDASVTAPIRNGSASGSDVLVTGTPPGPGDFSCPSGQRLVLASVSYTGITITDTDHNVVAPVDNLSRVLVNV
jgi:hypothetical protein